MKNAVVEAYENDREEDRLTTNNARKIEFLTTVRALDGLLPEKSAILDCAAGTGVYAFHFADRGHTVTATDITPRHIDVMRATLRSKPYQVETAVLDATNLSAFGDGQFDVVLNMGPFYHLTNRDARERCLDECARVLKKGGLLVTAYIPRYFIVPYLTLGNHAPVAPNLTAQLRDTGTLRHEDENCFWTDSYYSTPREMEALYRDHGLMVVDHFAQDGLTPQFAETVDRWDEAQFQAWCDYHYSVCREPSTLGASNHVVIVGRKGPSAASPV